MMYEMVANITSLVQVQTQVPSSSSSIQKTTDFWRQEAIKGYIGLYYYAAFTNLAHQNYLPPLDQLEEGNIFKNLVDASYADFMMLDNWFSGMDQQELKSSALHHYYVDASTSRKPWLKDSTTVYHERSVSAQG